MTPTPISKRNARHGRARRRVSRTRPSRSGYGRLHLPPRGAPHYLSLTQPLLSGIETGRWTATTSTVAVMELTVRPWQLNRPDIARAYEDVLTSFPNLIVADVTMDVAHQAARLRAEYCIRGADAIHVATALVHGATAFVTNDQQLTRLAPELDLIVLDALAAPSSAK